MMDQRGADWKGGGELKALHRIMRPGEENDAADMLPPRTHNGPPAAVFNVSAEDIEIEAQASIVDKALGESIEADKSAESKRHRVGCELARLQEIFFKHAHTIYQSRLNKMRELRSEGLSYEDIGKEVGLTRGGVVRVINNSETHLEQTRDGRVFYKWAATRFGLSKSNLTAYLRLGTLGEREIKRLRKHGKSGSANYRALAQLVKAEEKQKVSPTIFKKAFMALQLPARKATLLWACSSLIGSEDPQEIARWFAEALARR
jgi:hypothetical protein